MNFLKHARTITAIKTPYTNTGFIDFKAYDNIVWNQIQKGIQGLVVTGTTGEGHLMSWKEQLMLIHHTSYNFGKDLVVIGATGSNSTHEALVATEEAFNHGMHVALQLNPYYGHACEEGTFYHLNSLIDLGPTILYNVPKRTGFDMNSHLVVQLSKHENFKGIKECVGINRLNEYSKLNNPINVWSGNDNDCYDAKVECGINGVISVLANILPKEMDSLMKGEEKYDLKIKKFCNWMYQSPNPIGINTVMAMMGICQPVFKMPYLPLSYKERVKGKELLEELFEIENVRILKDDDFIILKKY